VRVLYVYRWIKPAQKRAAGQQMVHLVVWFSSVNLANHANMRWVVIAGKCGPGQMCREPEGA